MYGNAHGNDDLEMRPGLCEGTQTWFAKPLRTNREDANSNDLQLDHQQLLD